MESCTAGSLGLLLALRGHRTKCAATSAFFISNSKIQQQQTLENQMRFATCFVATALAALPAYAASPKVESATKTFQSVAADPAKVRTYCEMSKVMEAAGDQADAATEQKIQTFIKQLGPDFETAWNVGGELDENSPDATAYNSALDDLSSKCS